MISRVRSALTATATAVAVAALCVLGAGAGVAQAERVELVKGFSSALNGVATGADGNVYVVETFAQKVAVVSPAGTILREVPLPGPAGTATSAAVGPESKVWVAITSVDANRGFARVDAAGGVAPLSTAALESCGPVGMAPLAGRMLFTIPNPGDASCNGADYLGGFNGDGSAIPVQAIAGRAFDLAVTAGGLYVAGYDANTIQRWVVDSQGHFQLQTTFGIPNGSGADGIEVGPGGLLYVTMNGSGQVVRVDPTAGNGSDAAVVASGLVNPFGMANGSDGALYVASQDARVLRIAADGTQRFIPLPAGFKAWQVAARGDDIWVTDSSAAQAVVIRNAGRPEPAAPVPPAPVAPAPATPTAPLTPAPAKAVKLTAAKVFSLAAAKRCASRRSLTLTLRKRATGPKVASVKVTIGSGQAKTYKGAKLKLPVKLTGLPKGRFTVKVTVTLADGKTVKLTRAYRTCATKKATNKR